MKNPTRTERINEVVNRLLIAAEDLILLTNSGMGELDDKAFESWHLAQYLKNINQSICGQKEENES